jgi:hypothetical protein
MLGGGVRGDRCGLPGGSARVVRMARGNRSEDLAKDVEELLALGPSPGQHQDLGGDAVEPAVVHLLRDHVLGLEAKVGRAPGAGNDDGGPDPA